MTIPIGARLERKVLVTNDIAIDFMGVEQARVLATPWLIWHLEITCRDLVKPMVGEEFDSVGTEVNIKHLAATPVGMSATFRAEVVHVDGNRVKFRVEAHDERDKISEGMHERYVVNIARFATRLEAKARGEAK